jgi:thymidylate kinase
MERVADTDLLEGNSVKGSDGPEDLVRLLRASDDLPEKSVIRRLFDCLEGYGVSYCHWKSNRRLNRTLAGLEDIDLLVDPRDAALFYSAIIESGFKLAVSRSGCEHPGVFHALALGATSGALVDLHAHFQMVSGDSLVKTYRFPMERYVLETACRQAGVRVPQPAAELALFVLRIVLKHLSPIEILKTNRNYAKVSEELAWLLARSDRAAAAALCTAWFPTLDAGLFDRALDAVATDAALCRRIVLGWQVAWRLRHLRRLVPLPAMLSRYYRLMVFLHSRLTRRRDLSLQSGGAIIALVGAKGTGKSTVAAQLAGRLGRYLHVRRIHVGKPPPTILSLLPRLCTPVLRRLLPHERLAEYQSPARREQRRYSLLHVVRMWLLAYDRRRVLFRAMKAVTSGSLVLCDRYPSQTAGAIDSSCFDDAAVAACRSPLTRWLMMRERALYRDLPCPAVVLRLAAPLEIAIERDATRRKPGGPDPEAVRRRWSLENLAEFPESRVVCIDTTKPLDETARRAVQAIWEAL